jgi:IS5 family transposase
VLNPQKAVGSRHSEGSSEAEKSNVTTLLFRFVKQAASLAQKRCAASPTAVSDPTGNGFPGWKHVTLHFLRIHMDATYREIVD